METELEKLKDKLTRAYDYALHLEGIIWRREGPLSIDRAREQTGVDVSGIEGGRKLGVSP